MYIHIYIYIHMYIHIYIYVSPHVFFKAREASLRAAGALGRHGHRLRAAQRVGGRWCSASMGSEEKRWIYWFFIHGGLEWAIFHSRLLNNQRVTLGNHKSCIYIYISRLTPDSWAPASNDVWRMVWEDWAEILCANPGRAMLNWGRHNAQSLPVWKQSGPPVLGQVGPMLSHVGPHLGPILAQVGPMLGYVGLILSPCWAYVGPMLAYAGPMLAHVEPSWELC